jgi:ABC-type Zn uptake system ZnuABC Zn-binding protein ZnuA
VVVKKLKKLKKDNVAVILIVRWVKKDTVEKVVKDFTAKVANKTHPMRKFNRNKGQLRNWKGHWPVRCRS